MEPRAHADSFSRLAELYRCVETAARPRGSPAEVARWMFPQLRGGESIDLTRIGVTVVGKIASCVTARSSLLPEVASYFTELLRVLFADMNLMSHLVAHFEDEDQILSHLAAKSSSAHVLRLLHLSGAVCPVWKRKCLQAFDCSPPGRELDACLWSLTEVLKRLLKGADGELFGKVLRGFDCSLCALCLKYFPSEETAPLTEQPVSRQWGTTFCLLMDLVEVLTASSATPATGSRLQSQKVTYVQSAALLQVASSCAESSIRRRVLLLLKRAVLQRAGEDWSLGGALLTEPTHDMRRLCGAVLTAVAAGWLDSVRVDGASFFGGTKIGGDKFQRPDCVTLRAVSLLLLKSLELQTQSAAGTVLERIEDIHDGLRPMWCFLRRNSAQLQEVAHLCCWLSLLFGEQDDDIMEAAKALLSVFLHRRRRLGWDNEALLEAACDCGCNPHCHFLLLLGSVSFDHSVLLDFLISTETCFLEYFVRYLRFLRSDPRGFTAACRRIDSPRPKQRDESSTESSAEKFRLVDYPSSDESDHDETDSHGQSRTSRSTVGSVNEPAPNPMGKNHYLALIPSKTQSTARRSRGRLLLPPSRPSSKPTYSETSDRTVSCLSQLRQLVSRLHAKKLFPYKPSSLLKLLTQVDDCLRPSSQ